MMVGFWNLVSSIAAIIQVDAIFHFSGYIDAFVTSINISPL
jgi:hypothetical protein